MGNGPGQIPGLAGGVGDPSGLGNSPRNTEALDRSLFKQVLNQVDSGKFNPRLLFDAYDRVQSQSVKIDFLNLISNRLTKEQVSQHSADIINVLHEELSSILSQPLQSSDLGYPLAAVISKLGNSISGDIQLQDLLFLASTFENSQLSDPAILNALKSVQSARSAARPQTSGFDHLVDAHGRIQYLNEGVLGDAHSQSEAATAADIGQDATFRAVAESDVHASAAAREVTQSAQSGKLQRVNEQTLLARPDFQFVEGKNGTQQFMDQTGLTIKAAEGIREVGVSLAVMDGRQAAGHVYAFGGREMGIIGIFAQLGGLPPSLFISPMVDFLLARLVDKRNIYKFAIVADSVASIEKLHQEPNIRFVNVTGNMIATSFSAVYQSLREEEYLRIISIHLSPKLSRSYQLAKGAAERMSDMDIKVINSHTNGLGMGLLIQEVSQAIKDHYSPSDVYHLVQQCIYKLQYWAVPVAFNYTRNRRWIDRLPDSQVKAKLKMFNYKPIVTLKDDIELLDGYYDAEQAVSAMLHYLDAACSKGRKIRRIGVEYRGIYRHALGIQKKLQQRYPGIPVSLHVAGSVTASYFGPRMVGLCVI